MIYVGVCDDLTREVFFSEEKPTASSTKYLYAIGPFRTIMGANTMVQYGHNNPHCRTVDDAEKLFVKLCEGDIID